MKLESIDIETARAMPMRLTFDQAVKVNGCRFTCSEGTAETYRFCGEPKQNGSAYCPAHHQLCYATGARRKEAEKAFNAAAHFR